MLKTLSLLFFISIAHSGIAQTGSLGQIAMGAIGSRPKAKLQKHLLFNLNMTYPISTGNVIDGSKLKVPPIYVSAEYGIYENITIGLMGGYMKTETNGTIDQLANALQTGNFNDILSGLFGGLLGGGTTSTDPYRVTNGSILVGGTLKYNFVGNEKLNLFIANRTGLKIRTVKKEYTGDTGIELVDALVNTAESTSGIFSSFSFGGNYYLDKKKMIAISPEIGWGPGWGDGISISNNPILLTIGGTYHLRARTTNKK